MNTGNNQNKQLYSIGEVSSMTNIKSTVLRFWETEFEQLHPQKNKFGHRVYNNTDIETILLIKHYLYELGYTIKGARHIMSGVSNKQKQSDHPVIQKVKKDLQDMLTILKETDHDQR